MTLTKHALPYIIVLLLAIMLTQQHLFRLLTETYLGRIAAIAMIIFVANLNPILGILSVLAIIIAYNYNERFVVRSYNYYEGFSTDVNKKTDYAKEGFGMSERETNMLRGKQSNTVPVFNTARNQPDDVSPTDNNTFIPDFETV